VLPWLTTGDWTASGVEGAVVRRRGNSPLHSTHTRSTRKSRGVAVMGCAFPYTARRFFILCSPFFRCLSVKLRHSIFGLLLASGSALLVDLKTSQVLYSSNPDLVVPIASVTKLMTAMVVLDAKLPLDERLPITIRDAVEMQGVFSRVRVGSEISRRDMLLLTLMSSENRAA